MVMFDYAGKVVERKRAGVKYPAGARGDCQAAFDLANRICGSAGETNKYLSWLDARTVNLLDKPQSEAC